MNISDRKQLVRETSGTIEDQQHKNSISKMGSHAKLVCIAIFSCLGLIALAHCIPVEVIYTGEGCDCPTKLDFSVNVPSVAKTKKYRPSEYGYKIDVPKPRETKAKVTYSFDFEVEEPRPPKHVKPTNKANLYAMIDRVATKKGDCEDSYAAPPPTCRCGQCATVSEPFDRYVFKHMAYQPPLPLTPKCNCQRQHCNCNVGRMGRTTQYSPNGIFKVSPMRDYMLQSAALVPLETDTRDEERKIDGYGGGGGGDGDDADIPTVNVRRKRDLEHAFLRPRKFLNRRRPSRFVKLYRKDLADAPKTPQRLFDLESLINKQKRHHQQQQHQQQPIMRKTKRKAKKTPYAQQRSRLVKREIKGEYDLLEKEREQLDLTLPEIIQFMPETLQPDFKRGQCYYGCNGSTKTTLSATESSEHKTNGNENNPTSNEYSNINSEEAQRTDNDPILTETATDAHTDENDETDKNANTNNDHENNNTNTEHDANSTIENFNMDMETDVDHQAIARETSIEENLLNETNAAAKNNAINATFTKRQASNYHTDNSSSSSSSANAACSKCTARTKKRSSSTLKSKKSAYNAHSAAAPTFSTNPNYKPQQVAQNAPSATSHIAHASAEIATCEMKRKWNVDKNEYNKQDLTSSSTPLIRGAYDNARVDDHSASISAHYARVSDTPIPIIRPHDFVTPLHDHKYSIQFIDGEHLDKLIADIVYSHPEFLYATAHLGGALVDPESWQEQEAINYAKHLIDDRLRLLFGKENEFSIQQHIPSAPVPLYGILPPPPL
ncbi:uncharacterized protein Cp7Fb [Eurosta solidaginis]|uniref:uncharacterized protein Cp7Fb n=1 Tax=Eurosta solidaginis TaxID=178769 RepID=UPI003530AD11